jgi:hypothetical protein
VVEFFCFLFFFCNYLDVKSIKDLNLDILKIEATRGKDTVSKCKYKDAKLAHL